MRDLLSVCGWSLLTVVTVSGGVLQVPLSLAFRGDKSRRYPGEVLRYVGLTVAQLHPMWDFAISGALPDYQPRKTVLVCNHVSNSDVFLICSLAWPVKWLAKASLFKVPVLGRLMRESGYIPLKRGTKESIVDAMQICKEHLERDTPVILFPEGTRSLTGELLPFKDGAFRLAIETGADVLPLAVAGTKTALPKSSWRFGFSRGLVRVGKPITTTGMTLDDIQSLKAAARSQIETLYAQIQPLTVT